MKKVITTVFLFCVTLTYAQFSLNLGYDLKIGIIGTDNQYTTHDGVANYQIKVEFMDDRDHYFALGYKYVNLSEYYKALFLDIGKHFRNGKFYIIPQLELGHIWRERAYLASNFGVLYGGLNLAGGFYITPSFAFEVQGYGQWARDLPDRTFRYGSNIAVIFIFN